MKVALVYDRVNKIGGAERVLEALHQIWPQAPLFTAVYEPRQAKWASSFQVIPSFLNKFATVRHHHEWFAWAMPNAFESFNFTGYDVVISITSAEAKGIIVPPQTLHICYLLTPTRYLWSHTHLYRQGSYATNKNFVSKKLTPFFFSHLRQWDQVAAQRPDKMVVISKTVAKRLEKYYRRKADHLIYPPVSNIFSQKTPLDFDVPKNFYLLVSRLVPYKRIDLAIKAFNQTGENLLIVGEGAQKQRLRELAAENVKILGGLPQTRLSALYQHCQALVFPAEEDFGLVSVEAQFAGKPVIAYYKGGASETVIHRQTGFLFRKQSVRSIINAINQTKKITFTAADCRHQANQFSQSQFIAKFANYTEEQWHNHQNNQK